MDDNNNNQPEETNDLPIPNSPPSSDINQTQENYHVNTHFSTLSLSSPASTSRPPPSPFLLLPRTQPGLITYTIRPPTRTRPRTRPRSPPAAEAGTIPPPYPWAEDRRCMIRTKADLHSQNIFHISGEVRCSNCEGTYTMQHHLEEKFVEDMRFKEWMNPPVLDCQLCDHKSSVSPLINVRRRNINWLFLLLGQSLGFCNPSQLKYFCKYTANFRTGGKGAFFLGFIWNYAVRLTQPRPSMFDWLPGGIKGSF